MPTSAGATYGPLSIDEASRDDDGSDDDNSSTRSTRITTRWFRHRRIACSFSMILPLLLMLLALTSILLVAFTGRYHMSLLNLLRSILRIGGGGGSPNAVVEVCASNVELSRYRVVSSVEDMIMTRLATSFSGRLTNDDGGDGTPITSNGFLWDDEDGNTAKWRPQGVTTYRGASKNDDNNDTARATSLFALVSWYGRADEGYSDLGGRVSFVDVSDMMRRRRMRRRDDVTATTTTAMRATTNAMDTSERYYPYEHVLLVDERFCTLPSIHVGGIEYVNGTLYVADSRPGKRRILGFALDGGLYEYHPSFDDDGDVPPTLRHRYVLRISNSSFVSPITPSFLSYDDDRNEFVIGTYTNCVGKYGVHSMSGECFDRQENSLVWLDGRGGEDAILEGNDDVASVDDVSSSGNVAASDNATSYIDTGANATHHWHYFSEMQGAASATVDNATVVWVSSSYGPIGDSHLHVVRAPLMKGGHSPGVSMDHLVLEDVKIFRFPPGLEDLHIERRSADQRYMWMVTEFGTRRVFATRLEYLLR